VRIALLLLCLNCHGATLLRIACGPTGNVVDAQGNIWTGYLGATGGTAWNSAFQPALATQPPPYNAMQYGTALNYSLTAPQTSSGKYVATLKFIEPNKTAAGQRIFTIAVNGATINGPDLFSVAGLLIPYDVKVPISAPSGVITITLAGTTGNAVISGIQVDDVSDISGTSICATHQGLALGGSMFTGQYSWWDCENVSGTPLTIVRVRCRADVAGQILDVQLPNTTGTLQSILTAPLVCGPTGAEGAIVAGSSYLDGQVLTFLLTVVADATLVSTPQQILASVVFQ